MDIWTEVLKQEQLPLLARWIGREAGALTPSDLPADAGRRPAWFSDCAAESGRLNCLALVYETAVGVAGLRRRNGQETAAELSLLLGEVNYNLQRTATYVTLRMLDRAFLDLGYEQIIVRVFVRHKWFLEILERMGFSRTAEENGTVGLRVEKAAFLDRKYLF